uniref:Uncharacterized protein n=1 Tax=Glossina palpalis gambiensis TaxID=67801 RepID=A0A1B0C2M6_9MUSC
MSRSAHRSWSGAIWLSSTACRMPIFSVFFPMVAVKFDFETRQQTLRSEDQDSAVLHGPRFHLVAIIATSQRDFRWEDTEVHYWCTPHRNGPAQLCLMRSVHQISSEDSLTLLFDMATVCRTPHPPSPCSALENLSDLFDSCVIFIDIGVLRNGSGVLGASVSSVSVSPSQIISLRFNMTSSMMGIFLSTTPFSNPKNPSPSTRILSCSLCSRCIWFDVVLTARLYLSSSGANSNEKPMQLFTNQ